MSENRSRYSSAPMQNTKRLPKRSRTPQPPRTVGDYQDAGLPSRNFAVLQVLVTIALPILFLVSLLLRNTRLYLMFAALSAGSLLVMWLLSAFVPNARLTISFIHIAMILVALTAVWLSPSQPTVAPAQTTAASQGGEIQSLFSNELSEAARSMTVTEPESQTVAASAPNATSMAQQRLEQFMGAWVSVDYEAMVSLSVPSWVNQQKDPVQAMFQVRMNRTPIDYQFTNITGSDADSTRTIDMQTTISKNNGNPPEKFMIQVLMMRINDVWYVDPSSLGSSQVIADSSVTAVPVITIAPMVTASPDLRLYYNADGGTFYHVDNNCPSIHKDYLPLTASFTYSQVNESQYSKLQPCGTCHSPSRI